MNEKIYRANATILAVYPEAFNDPENPEDGLTAAILNEQFDFDTPADRSNMVFNISCAIDDASSFPGETDPETTSARTICDEGEVDEILYNIYEVTLDAFRDEDVDDENVFNLFFWLFTGPDRPYYIITRIGKNSNEEFAIGDDVSIFGVTTDNPVDLVASDEMIRFGARFVNTGYTRSNVRLVA